ncbi:calcium-binding protein [Sinorhizobium meliloti]|uniref:calcium-binding protein n=1 Tax=Rhizobium meliloti TaxID=382 RepID=UPI002380959D|nr:calcium-binding protein [Sinorhizobium meliloti]MDE3816037.1 calcium-binding protein [Sinorhizobium meliloti]MDW9502120.1 calcium-binding protein [Sinorhizobium meliloti]MDW9614762.1 calcium-binding protein [Sinorhizobium meliloti]MDW9769720.1 calcium-binding protein [Sinorhizobium meliloti]MDW9837437.1 calcium-binding protein [Sinorhizobium meliloti]
MATITYHFPGGLYPSQYNPPLSGVSVNPTFGELVDMSEASRSTTTSTEVLYRLDNGLRLKLVGTGFSFNSGGDAVGGTITSIQVLLNNGTTLVQTISGLSLSLEIFHDAAAAFDNDRLESWLLSGDDTINGSAGDDVISGHLGNDVLNGNAGSDTITGGGGDDTYDGGAGFDALNFQDAYNASTAFRGISLNAATGTAIDQFGFSETFQNFEEYRGTQFADSMIGSSIDETFMGLGGRDAINGAAGVDTVRYDRDFQVGATKGVTVNLTTGVAIDSFGSQDSLTSIEHVRGTGFKDSITGNSVSNFLRGFAGADTLNGGAANDVMRGGLGDDTYFVDNAGDIVDENSDSGAGLDIIRSGISLSLANTAAVKGNVEYLVLLGTGAINGSGNALNNAMSGNGAANTLNGAAGNDLLNGSLGNDTLIGSAGLDTFFFSTALNASSNVDTIVDFVVADDTIRLEDGIFTAVVGTGVLTAAQFATNSTGLAEDADDRIIYESDTGQLLYDSDGNGSGGSVHFATIGTNLAISAADFFIT